MIVVVVLVCTLKVSACRSYLYEMHDTCDVNCSGIAAALMRVVGRSTEALSGSMSNLVSLVW